MEVMSTPANPGSMRTSPFLVPFLDAVVVLVFAALGRREHDSGNPVSGVMDTAWPFLVGALVGHLLVRFAMRRSPEALVSGVVVWVCTVLIGMVLRQVTGDGTAFAFIVVATCFTGALMLGARAVRAWMLRRTA